MPKEESPTSSPSSIELPRADAIHRALLTGLLGNVGLKADAFEYAGPRGKHFSLFPGSALFKRRPQWVMAAELVETTKLYARTNAPVRPEWIERAALHLVKREHWDPHWKRERSRVEAWERVTLQGLVLFPKTAVDYGPIDPKISREIFILHALVRGEYRTDAPYARHNQRLIEQVQLLEAKARRRDVMVGEEARFKFFDARVPQRVYNGHEFEKWRQQAERHNPAALRMNRADLLLHDPLEVTEAAFPDSILVNGTKLALEYRYEPASTSDGVTTVIPLAALNGLPEEPFDWLIPGMLHEKIVALIRTLPKPIRVQLIPAPDFADAAMKTIVFREGPLLEAVALHLGRKGGVVVPKSGFDSTALPPHLLMNFKVVDTAGKVVAQGRDLSEIRKRLGIKARTTFAAMPPSEWHRDGIVRWEFGESLPWTIEIRRQGMTLLGYPTLVENADGSVSLRVLDAPADARTAMRTGLRRLFMIQLAQELKYVIRKLPNIEPLALNYARLGTWESLKEDLLLAIADRAFFSGIAGDPSETIRTRERFAAAAEAGWRRLSASANEVAAVVADALSLYQSLSLALGRDFPPMLLQNARDMREQLARLVYKGFVAQTSFDHLRNLPRYLRGIQIRLEKLMNAGLQRDAMHLAEVAPLQLAYLQRRQRHIDRRLNDPALEEFRWMLEELRVLLFAQELRGAAKVSVKRLETFFAEQVQP